MHVQLCVPRAGNNVTRKDIFFSADSLNAVHFYLCGRQALSEGLQIALFVFKPQQLAALAVPPR